MTKRMTNNVYGFTLIEVMIVVAIVGILVLIAVPNFLGFQERAKRKVMMEVASSAKSELLHWLDAANSGQERGKGVVDVNGDGKIAATEFHGDKMTIPNSWIQSFYGQRGGTAFSPWYGKGIFTVAPVNAPHSGQIVMSSVNGGDRILIKAFTKYGDAIFFDSIAIE